MFKVIASSLLFSTIGHAVTLNYTLINQCAENFTNYNDLNGTNRTEIFNACISKAEIRSKKPQDCYQSEAAYYALEFISWASLGLFLASLVLNNAEIIIKFLSQKGFCPHCCSKLAEITSQEAQDPTDSQTKIISSAALLRSFSGKAIATLSTIVTGIITYVSTNWIFDSLGKWTSKDADCQYWLDQQ